MTSYISMLTLTVLATMAVAVISALPRGDLSGEQGNLYPAIYREQQLNDKDGRTLDSLGGGNFLRDLESELRSHPNLYYGRAARNLDSLSGITFGSQKRYDPYSTSYGQDKRNFDEIDRSGFNSFTKKRNFDEIDRTGFDGFVKRNFDEIDRVGFGSFLKKRDLRQ